MISSKPIRCLITAGPTREYYDPVRFISSPATGRMGYALAQAALQQNWTVDLISGPTELTAPAGVTFYSVESGKEMFVHLDTLFDTCDVLLMAAAVADYRPRQAFSKKQKKQQKNMVLELVPVVDILESVAKRKSKQVVVGFAAETHDVEHFARAKMQCKRCDWIAANNISTIGAGFASDTNTLLLMNTDGEKWTLGPDLKTTIAKQLIAILQNKHPHLAKADCRR